MSTIRRLTLLAAAVATPLLPLRAQGVLSGVINADNAFTAFVGTASAVPGPQVASGTEWWRTVAFGGVALQAGQDYVVRVRVQDVGTISGFLATLTLAGDTHRFTTGGTTLLTTAGGGWTATTSDWRTGPQGLVAYGAKGTAIWGNQPASHTPVEWAQQSAAAQWIWTADDCIHCTRYFSATIVAVPEPATLAMLGAGLAVLAFATRRRRA